MINKYSLSRPKYKISRGHERVWPHIRLVSPPLLNTSYHSDFFSTVQGLKPNLAISRTGTDIGNFMLYDIEPVPETEPYKVIN